MGYSLSRCVASLSWRLGDWQDMSCRGLYIKWNPLNVAGVVGWLAKASSQPELFHFLAPDRSVDRAKQTFHQSVSWVARTNDRKKCALCNLPPHDAWQTSPSIHWAHFLCAWSPQCALVTSQQLYEGKVWSAHFCSYQGNDSFQMSLLQRYLRELADMPAPALLANFLAF